jgi:hypothetical protein
VTDADFGRSAIEVKQQTRIGLPMRRANEERKLMKFSNKLSVYPGVVALLLLAGAAPASAAEGVDFVCSIYNSSGGALPGGAYHSVSVPANDLCFSRTTAR